MLGNFYKAIQFNKKKLRMEWTKLLDFLNRTLNGPLWEIICCLSWMVHFNLLGLGIWDGPLMRLLRVFSSLILLRRVGVATYKKIHAFLVQKKYEESVLDQLNFLSAKEIATLRDAVSENTNTIICTADTYLAFISLKNKGLIQTTYVALRMPGMIIPLVWNKIKNDKRLQNTRNRS